MSDINAKNSQDLKFTQRAELARKLDAVGWGLFFIWVGIAMLADVGWGVGLLGVGIITLGMQVVQKFVGLKLEGFWIVVGLLFAVGGIWELYEFKLSLVPILLIIAGIALLLSITRGRHKICC